MRLNFLLQILKPFSFTHITIWFSSSTQMLKKNIYSQSNLFILVSRKKRSWRNFRSHRITRRDIDNTHRANGIS